MTSWGNTKQRLALWAAVAFLIISMLFSAQYVTHLDQPVYKILIVASLVMALISFVGIWTLGLDKSSGPDEHEVADDIF